MGGAVSNQSALKSQALSQAVHSSEKVPSQSRKISQTFRIFGSMRNKHTIKHKRVNGKKHTIVGCVGLYPTKNGFSPALSPLDGFSLSLGGTFETTDNVEKKDSKILKTLLGLIDKFQSSDALAQSIRSNLKNILLARRLLLALSSMAQVRRPDSSDSNFAVPRGINETGISSSSESGSYQRSAHESQELLRIIARRSWDFTNTLPKDRPENKNPEILNKTSGEKDINVPAEARDIVPIEELTSQPGSAKEFRSKSPRFKSIRDIIGDLSDFENASTYSSIDSNKWGLSLSSLKSSPNRISWYYGFESPQLGLDSPLFETKVFSSLDQDFKNASFAAENNKASRQKQVRDEWEMVGESLSSIFVKSPTFREKEINPKVPFYDDSNILNWEDRDMIVACLSLRSPDFASPLSGSDERSLTIPSPKVESGDRDYVHNHKVVEFNTQYELSGEFDGNLSQRSLDESQERSLLQENNTNVPSLRNLGHMEENVNSGSSDLHDFGNLQNIDERNPATEPTLQSAISFFESANALQREGSTSRNGATFNFQRNEPIDSLRLSSLARPLEVIPEDETHNSPPNTVHENAIFSHSEASSRSGFSDTESETEIHILDLYSRSEENDISSLNEVVRTSGVNLTDGYGNPRENRGTLLDIISIADIKSPVESGAQSEDSSMRSGKTSTIWSKTGLLLLEFEKDLAEPIRENVRKVRFEDEDVDSECDSTSGHTSNYQDTRNEQSIENTVEIPRIPQMENGSNHIQESGNIQATSLNDEEERVFKNILNDFKEVFTNLFQKSVKPCNEYIRSFLGKIMSLRIEEGQLNSLGLGVMNDTSIIGASIEENNITDTQYWHDRLRETDWTLQNLEVRLGDVYEQLVMLNNMLEPFTVAVTNSITRICIVRNRILRSFNSFIETNYSSSAFDSINGREISGVDEYKSRTNWYFCVDTNELEALLREDVKALFTNFNAVSELLWTLKSGLAGVEQAMGIYESSEGSPFSGITYEAR